MADRLAVVVCVYTEKRWDLILGAVGSVLAQERAADEILVVVDHNDALRSRLAQSYGGDGRIRIVSNAHGQGLSGGRNTGVGETTSEIVVFLDDDAAAAPGWLAALEAAYADPAVLGAGGRIDADWARARPRWWPPSFDWVVGCTYEGMPTAAAPVRNVIGANMSFRRSALEGTSGFTEGVGRSVGRPMGGEETELSIRVLAAHPGSRILYVPDALVRHHVPASRATVRYFLARCYAEGLSKATIAGMVGAGQGLASERRHAVVTLPRAVARALARALKDRDPGQAAQATMITFGLAATVAGYGVGWVGRRVARR